MFYNLVSFSSPLHLLYSLLQTLISLQQCLLFQLLVSYTKSPIRFFWCTLAEGNVAPGRQTSPVP